MKWPLRASASTPDCKERNGVLLNVRWVAPAKRHRCGVGDAAESLNRRKQPPLIRSDSGRHADGRAGAAPLTPTGRSAASYDSSPELQQHVLHLKAFRVDVTAG